MIDSIILPQAETVEELRKTLEVSLNRLVAQLRQQDFTKSYSCKGHRLRDIAAPGAGSDAVNLEYLEQQLAALR